MPTHTNGPQQAWPASAALGAADWVCLAAAPTFAIMALMTGVRGDGSHDLFCAAVQDASPLSGMAWMYILMSAVHSVPWLKLIASRRSAPRDAVPSSECIQIPTHLSLSPRDPRPYFISRMKHDGPRTKER
jgi:hypothetical protein